MKSFFLAVVGAMGCVFCIPGDSFLEKFTPAEIASRDTWGIPYKGNYSLSHKIFLCWPGTRLEDKLLAQLYIYYAMYKINREEDAMGIFDSVELILDQEFNGKSWSQILK